MSGLATARISLLPIDACRTGIASHPMYHQCDKCDCKSYCEIFPLVQENKKLLEVSDADFFAGLKQANAELQAERLQKLHKKNKPSIFKIFLKRSRTSLIFSFIILSIINYLRFFSASFCALISALTSFSQSFSVHSG